MASSARALAEFIWSGGMPLAESLLRLEEVEALKGCGVEVEEEKPNTEHAAPNRRTEKG